MKHLLIYFLFFSITMQTIYADSTSANNSCPGEQIEQLHSISANTSHVETGSVTDGSDDYDHYYFTPGEYGTLTLSYSSTNQTDVKISIASCQDDSIADWNNASSEGPITITLNNTDTVYIQIFAQQTANYTITMDFAVTAPPTKDFTCANPKPFDSVFSINTTGNTVILGNTSLCADDGSGTCEDPGTATNNDITMMNYDADSDAATTINSSAANLVMPADATVVYAGLHWQGYLVNGTQAEKDSAATIKFKFDGNSYNTTTVNSTNMNWVYFDSSRFYYQGYVDLTAYVQTNGAGKYWVGDIISDTGAGLPGGGFGGWAITVVYKSDLEEFRNLSVYSGYEGIAGATDIANAVAYADANGCDNTNTGVGNNVSTTVTGFLTPKQAPVSSRLTVFAGEGDVGISDDSITITKKDGTPVNLSNGVNPSNNVMNSSISVDGVYVTSGDPHHSNNSLGIDIDQYDTSLIMDTEQTSTTITLNTSGDGYFPAVYAFAAQLYEPQMCYDYSYSQNNRFFTEENNGTAAPRIAGTVEDGVDINVSIYIRNNELSDFSASNLKLSIRDINTSQASYVTNSTMVTKANQTLPEPAVIDSSGASFIRGIDEGDIPGRASTFTYFTINPSTSDLNISLDANISYELILPDGSGGFLPPIRYDSDLGSDKVKMCPVSGGLYTPSWGSFNIEDTNLALADPGKYNLYTQVVNRPFTFDVVSYDPNNLTVETNSTMFVGIDMIDAGGYHNIEAACSDPSAAISPTIRVNLLNGETRKTINLDDAVAAGYITSVNEFVQEARENVAFRVSYLVDKNGSGEPIEYNYDPTTNVVVMTGFTTVAGQECAIDPRTGSPKIVQKPNGGTTTLAPVACGNAGTTGVTPAVLDQCLQCITESDVKYECSRDNFAIRPEAFMLNIYDNNQTNSTTLNQLPYTSDISAGYSYRYDVNATTHTSENAAIGYTESFVIPVLDRNITYYWRPDPLRDVSGCNDVINKNPDNISLANGYAANKMSTINNVGRYELEMRDKTWTKADQSPAHHTTDLVFNGVTYTATDHYNLDDCSLNESFVPLTTTALNNTNIGCVISSSHINQNRPGIVYSDYNVTIHPYDFNLSSMTFNKGVEGFEANVSTNDYVYINNILDDSNMSLRYSGQIRAVGANTVPLNNFVDKCYAEDLDLDLVTSALPSTPLFRYRLRETNTSNGLIFRDTNGTGIVAGNLDTVELPASSFLHNSFGISDIEFNVNFDRNVTGAVNPFTVTYNRFDVACKTSLNCQSYAKLAVDHLPDSNITSNSSVTHIYGRVHTPRQRVANPNPANTITATIPLYYEFYCNNATGCNIADYDSTTPVPLSPSGLLSQDDVRWYVQDMHATNIDGNATTTQARNALDNLLLPTRIINPGSISANYTYNGNANGNASEGYPYKTTIELNASNWLIYNRFDAAADVNDFELEFFSTGTFAGQDESGVNMDANTSINVNRRISW